MHLSSVDWLLDPKDPSVRHQTLVDILHRKKNDAEVEHALKKIPGHRTVRRIMGTQTREGYWRPKETCYTPKWTSAVWPLILLGEMGVPPNAAIKSESERFLDLHQLNNGAFTCPTARDVKEWEARHHGKKGRRWEEPCLTGNMIRTLLVFGYGDDERVRKAIDWMPEHQLEDGGWNCDYPEKKVRHSSFMSTIEPLWAYSEIPRAKWTRKMKRSIDEGAEFILMHHVYKSDNHQWRETYPFFTKLHFPMYYFYDILHALRVLTKLGYADDERIQSAVQLLLSKRRPDGRWNLEGDWYREGDYFNPTGKGRKAPIAIEEIDRPSKWITLNCYRVLTATNDIDTRQRS
jgi:hypothetical protein